MKIKMLKTVMNKIDGIHGPFCIGVEYNLTDAACAAFVASGLAEYVDSPPVYETAVNCPVIETPEDAAPRPTGWWAR